MLTAVKLRDQWSALERRLPSDWESVALRIRTEQPNELSEAARVLAPMGVGRAGEELALTVLRAGGNAGPEAARRLFSRLDERRVWCLLEQERVDVVDEAPPGLSPVEAPVADGSVAQAWDTMLAGLPSDWSDLLCSLELDSSALLARAALLCAPLNPARDRARAGFTFRAARRTGLRRLARDGTALLRAARRGRDPGARRGAAPPFRHRPRRDAGRGLVRRRKSVVARGSGVRLQSDTSATRPERWRACSSCAGRTG